MKLKRALVVVLVLVALVGGTIAWRMTHDKSKPQDVSIGAVLPLSGPAAFLGESMLNGLRLAEEDANTGKFSTLPFRIRLIAEDGAAVPRTSVSAYQKLTGADGAKIIVTTASGVSMALKPLAEQDGVLLFANATHPAITADVTTVLRHSQTATQEAEVITSSITRAPPENGVAVVYENDDYGTAFAREVRRALQAKGVRVLAEVPFEATTADVRVLAQKALANKPDVVVVLGVGKNLGLLIRRLREYRFEGRLYSGIGFIVVPGAKQAAGEFASGVSHTDFAVEADDDYKELAARYKERFGQEMGATALISYNTIKVLCAAMGGPDREPAAVARRIREMGEFRGVGERITITPRGDLLPHIRIAAPGK